MNYILNVILIIKLINMKISIIKLQIKLIKLSALLINKYESKLPGNFTYKLKEQQLN